jgi:hypothetical protein
LGLLIKIFISYIFAKMSGLPPNQQNPPPPGPLTPGSSIDQFLEVTDTLKVGHIVSIDSAPVVLSPELDIIGNLNSQILVLESMDADGQFIKNFSAIYSWSHYADYIRTGLQDNVVEIVNQHPFGPAYDSPVSTQADLLISSSGRTMIQGSDYQVLSADGTTWTAEEKAEVVLCSEFVSRIAPNNGTGDVTKAHLEISMDSPAGVDDTGSQLTLTVGANADKNAAGQRATVGDKDTLLLESGYLNLKGMLCASGVAPNVQGAFVVTPGITVMMNETKHSNLAAGHIVIQGFSSGDTVGLGDSINLLPPAGQTWPAGAVLSLTAQDKQAGAILAAGYYVNAASAGIVVYFLGGPTIIDIQQAALSYTLVNTVA